MAKRESSPGISPAKKRIWYRSGSNFNAEYTRTFDWVMASDRGKQQAYCKVCSKHFSISHGGIDWGRQKAFRTVQRIFKKNHGFSARCPAFIFQKLNMSGIHSCKFCLKMAQCYRICHLMQFVNDTTDDIRRRTLCYQNSSFCVNIVYTNLNEKQGRCWSG